MKKFFFFVVVLLSFFPAFAKHITGGEIIYDYLGPGASGSSSRYHVTLILFRDNNCVACSVMPVSVTLGVFDNDDNSKLFLRTVPLESTAPLEIIASPPCLTNQPALDYSAGYYPFDIDVPINLNGYTITYQTCCRVDGITNIGNTGSIGATYTGNIPGSNTLLGGTDNSARFRTGISILCNNKRFILDFSATDPDAGDSLVYSFADAYDGGRAIDASFADPDPPPYPDVPYGPFPYTGESPLGPLATINTSTGIITGIAPDAGKYIVCVVVQSYRNGKLVAEHRKDFIVTVAPCDFASADLPAIIRSCDSYDKTFQNENNSPLNLTYFWDFGDPASGAANTATTEVAFHHYLAAGDYNLTLIVNAGQPCADTAYAVVKVYPGFFPGITFPLTTCINLPVQFTDTSRTDFGVINYWHWNFGDPSATADTSRIKNPVYTYHTAGTFDIQFIVGTSKGCLDTLRPAPQITIVDRPDFQIFPRDTLICYIDTLQIRTNVSTGSITWSPNIAINDIHSFNPNVSPDGNTTYIAMYTDPSGCSITDSAKIRSVSGVNLAAQRDTTLCKGDSTRLMVVSNAIYYSWSPGTLTNDSTLMNPVVHPVDPSTDFHVHASISAKCFNDAVINVRSIPYPDVIITGDTAICYGNSAQLHASGGSSYNWSPIAYLNNSHIPDPISIRPKANITYTVTVRDTLGCPKPVSKDFKVEVIRLVANAGPQDTSVVEGQPLQLQATGGSIYLWDPGTYLDNPNIATPISTPRNNITYTVHVSNAIGCAALDTIRVHVFYLPPGLYVPSAFTPANDGLNDLFRPIALGIRTLINFRVYSRWGMLLYETSTIGEGWDGTYNGKGQDPGTYVWQAEAVDYKGNKIFKKGTVILIR